MSLLLEKMLASMFRSVFVWLLVKDVVVTFPPGRHLRSARYCHAAMLPHSTKRCFRGAILDTTSAGVNRGLAAELVPRAARLPKHTLPPLR